MSTVIIGVLLAGAVALIVRKMIQDKKAGKSGCGCGCEGCPSAGACHGGTKE